MTLVFHILQKKIHIILVFIYIKILFILVIITFAISYSSVYYATSSSAFSSSTSSLLSIMILLHLLLLLLLLLFLPLASSSSFRHYNFPFSRIQRNESYHFFKLQLTTGKGWFCNICHNDANLEHTGSCFSGAHSRRPSAKKKDDLEMTPRLMSLIGCCCCSARVWVIAHKFYEAFATGSSTFSRWLESRSCVTLGLVRNWEKEPARPRSTCSSCTFRF